MMRIGITGATGFIGREIAAKASAEGVQLVGYSRSAESKSPRGPITEWRKFEPSTPIDATGLDAVIHLAGESILGRWTDEKKRRILSSRIDGTRAVVQGIAAVDGTPPVLVSGSAIGFYGDTGEHVVNESSPRGDGFLADVATAWEAEALRSPGRTVVLRTGFVIGRRGGAMRLIAPVFRAGLGGPLGSGNQWMSCIHVSDVAKIALVAARDSTLAGPVNAVMPNPVRNREFTKAVAKAAGRIAILPAPKFAIRAVLGELSALLLESQRVVPTALEKTGYSFCFPDLASGLRDVFHES